MENLEIKVLKELDSELKKKIDYLDYICFHQEKLSKKQEAQNQDKFASKNDRFAYVIAFIDGHPVGVICLFKRQINFCEKTILLGGFGGVCTDPEYQRQGIATKLLPVAIDELKKADCDIAYLCTDVSKLGKLYGQVGFVQLNRQHTYRGLSGKRYTEWDGMIAPINAKDIFEEVFEDSELFDLQGTNW